MFGWRFLAGALAAALALCTSGQGWAQAYPQRPVKLIVPAPPGGPTDVPARLVADGLQKMLGQPFVVEDRAAGGGVVATGDVARAAPDGYTLLFANSSVLAVNPALYAHLPYDPATAFVPVGLAFNSPQIMVANKNVPYNTVPEMVAYAKAHPGKINFATAAVGTLPHLTAVLFKMETGIDALLVTYAGGAPAMTAVVAGQADVLFDLVRTRVKSGEVKALCLTGAARDPDLPNVPTIGEAGYPGVTSTSWNGIVAPAGTPKAVIALLNAKINELVRDPAFKAKALGIGLVAAGGTPDEFAAHIARERERWTKVVKVSGAKVE
jgi:tripartite-type tricarboxylate transporter receptor subunit TctC